VNGTLDVQGTASNPVVFTSGRDDQYGGDSNGDGNGTLPAAGNWGYIKFTSQSNVTNTFDYCIVKYGGYSYDNVYYSRMLWITSANTTVLTPQIAGHNLKNKLGLIKFGNHVKIKQKIYT
jgi:hypothetical protein